PRDDQRAPGDAKPAEPRSLLDAHPSTLAPGRRAWASHPVDRNRDRADVRDAVLTLDLGGERRRLADRCAPILRDDRVDRDRVVALEQPAADREVVLAHEAHLVGACSGRRGRRYLLGG